MEATVVDHFNSIKDKFNFDLKKEQVEIIAQLILGRDVTALLPTGFGKSMCFILPPIMKNMIVSRTFTF